jgi:hypothetical protein
MGESLPFISRFSPREMLVVSMLSFISSSGMIATFVAGGVVGTLLARVVRTSRSGAKLVLAIPDLRPAPTGARRHPRAPVHDGSTSVDADAVARAKPSRSGRLPLPRRVAELTPADSPGLAAVDTFAERLAELPAEHWLAVGRELIADGAAADGRVTAIMSLETAIVARELGIAAWYVRDAVDTSAYLAGQSVTRWTSAERRAFAAAHGAAEDAALALLARPGIAPAELAVLCAPFDSLLSKDSPAVKG